MAQDERRIPVIIGAGEVNDRPESLDVALDSIALMAEAARRADADAGGGALAKADYMAIVPQISFRDLDERVLLPEALGLAGIRLDPKIKPHGNAPLLLLSNVANAIGRGEANLGLVVGGEALRTAARRVAGRGDTVINGGSKAYATGLQQRYGLYAPSDVYPLYENATRALWGQTLAQGQAETGVIWSNLSKVAAGAEGAWLKQPRTAEEITTVTMDNRPIAFPYTKLTVANSSVNQGAALLVASLAKARELGIAEDRLVYIGAGAGASEADDLFARESFCATAAMRATLAQVLVRNGLTTQAVVAVDLYSCFPSVPKMARRLLDMPAERPLTVHGGLTFGGGPLANYMMHAAAAMVRQLRGSAHAGLLYGNGGFCTDHHALVLADHPLPGVSFPQDHSCQAEADALRGAIPAIGDDYEGPVTLETYTVLYDRTGAADHGVVIARDPAGNRVLASVPKEDAAMLDFLTNGRAEPVGVAGHTTRAGGVLRWQRD